MLDQTFDEVRDPDMLYDDSAQSEFHESIADPGYRTRSTTIRRKDRLPLERPAGAVFVAQLAPSSSPSFPPSSRRTPVSRVLLTIGLLLSLLVALPAGAQDATITAPDRDDLVEASILRVVDGDTIHVELDGVDQTIRLIGIDTPETVDPRQDVACFGTEASSFTKRLLAPGATVYLEKDVSETDRYQRLLRYVWLEYDRGSARFVDLDVPDGVEDGDLFSFNLLLVSEGYAASSPYAPDVRHQDAFDDAETAAREDERGLWGECGAFGVSADLPASPVADCSPFSDFEQAQQYYLAHQDEAEVIDPDADGFACEVYFAVDTTGLVPPDGVGSTTGSGSGSGDSGGAGVLPGGDAATEAPAVPVATEAPVAPPAASQCDPSYPGVCIPPIGVAGDLDCGQISYRGFQVVPPDPHGFDGDNDGVGCEG